jgi:hypothetical protein
VVESSVTAAIAIVAESILKEEEKVFSGKADRGQAEFHEFFERH